MRWFWGISFLGDRTVPLKKDKRRSPPNESQKKVGIAHPPNLKYFFREIE
ncbi:MAG: hypothetical protein ACXITR_10625 [Cyanobacterium sp.]